MRSYLDTLVDHERQTGLGVPTLDRITALVEALGNPHRAFRSIHVTGTNGKGSVAAAASALLRGRGLRVGTYGSPHVSALTERVALDGRPVPDESLERAVDLVRRAARSRGISPTWFEVITAAAFLLFAQARIEVAVVEVGMLGRWDATNVVRGDVAVVTNVGLDHTDLAGPTRADVAREKAGIVDPGATLVLGEQDPRLRPLFEAPGPSRVLTAGRELTWSRRRLSGVSAQVDLCTARAAYRDVPVAMPGRHQCDNVLLAVAAAEELLGAPLDAASVRRALAGVWLPGRGEIAGRRPLVMLDGAHNAPGLTALRATVAELRAGGTAGPAVLVCGVLRGRDLAPELSRLAADFDRTIVCAPDSPRALPPPDLAALLAASLTGPGQVTDVITDPAAATRAATATAGRDRFVLVTGSMHLLAQARAGLPRTGPFPGA